ncbi:hypothetical protein QOZ80_1BG0054500 [Eleusine coracana subsp. coracana]|nr:hypothetical protein QOZ80_1BG0054500 [Eleusine coracana subsp. coracana]
MAATTSRVSTACHAFLTSLHARALKLRNNHRDHLVSSGEKSSPSSSSTPSWPVVVLATLLCAAATALLFPRAVAFFLPLVASTSAFCATAYLAGATDPYRGAANEVVLVGGEGEPAEAGTLQLCADADATAYAYGGGGMKVGCFIRKSARRGVDEDGEEVVLAGRLLVPAPAAAVSLDEELVSLQVDRLAEGVWNSYFGRWSTWNHYYGLDGCDDW